MDFNNQSFGIKIQRRPSCRVNLVFLIATKHFQPSIQNNNLSLLDSSSGSCGYPLFCRKWLRSKIGHHGCKSYYNHQFWSYLGLNFDFKWIENKKSVCISYSYFNPWERLIPIILFPLLFGGLIVWVALNSTRKKRDERKAL